MSCRKLLLICLSMVSMSVSAGPITYSVFDNIEGATVSGSITTDGTIGALSNSNITDWNILLDDGTYTSVLDSTTSFLHSGNSSSNLIASASDLSYDHSFGSFFLIFANDFVAYWCQEGPLDGCSGIASSSNIAIANNGSRAAYYDEAYTGVNSLGGNSSSVPEPSITLLLGLGLVVAGVARKKTA